MKKTKNEDPGSQKEERGEIKSSFKKFFFPEIGETIEAENLKEATEKASRI